MKPILFSTPMVQAILEGRKTQTRRVVPEGMVEKYYEYDDYANAVAPRDVPCTRSYEHEFFMARARYRVGDVLWVRETWKNQFSVYWYKAGPFPQGAIPPDKWKPSIFMPREAARIFLKVTDVRVERIQDITVSDSRAEGIIPTAFRADMQALGYAADIRKFIKLWDSINDKRGYGWDKNPWVYVITFDRRR